MKVKANKTTAHVVCNHKKVCMEVLVAQLFRVVLLIICDISANSMTHLCTDGPIERKFKAENLFSHRSDKTFWCVHCVCRSDFFYIMTSKFPPARFFSRILMFSHDPATLHIENLLCGAKIGEQALELTP